MDGLSLLIGHLVGDYIFQNDWMAANKASRSWPCLVHCLLYACAVMMFSAFHFPVTVGVLAGVLHFPVDRFRLAREFMLVNGQASFATGPLAPWSVIVVDNTIHLAVLFGLALAIGPK